MRHKPVVRFDTLIIGLRQALHDTALSREMVARQVASWTLDEILQFRKNFQQRLARTWRWDLWAVGAIFTGQTPPGFSLGFEHWLILQGDEFLEQALRKPDATLSRLDPGTPSTNFDLEEPLWGPIGDALVRMAQDGFRYIGEIREGGSPSGKRWGWRELKSLHPDLWERLFVRSDRRAYGANLHSMSDYEVVERVMRPLHDWICIYEEPEYVREQYGLLNEAQRTVNAVRWFDSETKNGGVDQFFHNDTGVLAQDALEGFRRIGARKAAAYVEGVFRGFPGGSPSRDHETRRGQMKKRWGNQTLDEALPHDGGEDLEMLLASYIRAHAKDLFRTDST